MRKIDRQARILILGAGPGGLSAAYYMRQHGYKNVTVFEKLGRVGGLCRTVTEDYQSFDLGAVMVSPDYCEVLNIARQTGARFEKVIGGAAFSLEKMMAFYARLPTDTPTEADERRLREHVQRYVKAFGGRIQTDDDWHAYDAWLYFKHVSAAAFRDGYYDRWERIQGDNRTYYVGGLFDFDYVEGIVRYSRALIEKHFVEAN